MVVAPPQAWTKHGEIFSDEESRSIFVCSQCLEHVERFDLGFMATDAVSFWSHISEHMTVNNHSPKRHENYSSEEPLRKKAKIQNIVIIDLDDDDDTVENCDLIAKKVAEISKIDNDTTNPIVPQSQNENITDKELEDIYANCEMEQKVLASQNPDITNDMLNCMEFINQKDEEKRMQLEPILAKMMTDETKSEKFHTPLAEEVKNEAKMLVIENRTEPQQTSDTCEQNNCPADDVNSVKDTSDNMDLFTILKERSVDEYHSFHDLIELSDEDEDEDDRSSSSTLSTAAVESGNPTRPSYRCICPWCKAFFTNGDLFLEHLKMHERKEKSKCQTQSRKSPLLPTITADSPKEANFPSPSKTPPTERPFKCNFCPEAFCGAWQLDRHHTMHLLATKKKKTSAMRPFQCNTCGKRTNSESAMRTHQQRFHSNEDNPDTVKCTICEKIILQKNLHQHMDVHSHDRPRHKCHICSKQFSVKQSHTKHMKKVHGLELLYGKPSNTSAKNSDNSRFDLSADNNATRSSLPNNEPILSNEYTENQRLAMSAWLRMHETPPPQTLPENAAADARWTVYPNPFNATQPMHPNLHSYPPMPFSPHPMARTYGENLWPRQAEQYH